MRSLLQTSGVLAAIVGLSLVFAPSPGLVQEKETKEQDRQPAAKADPKPLTFEAIRQRLKKPVALEFVDTPLVDVVKYASSQLDVPIIIDVRALKADSIQNDAPVTMTLKGTRADVALRQMLANAGQNLDFAIRDGFVLISTRMDLDEIYETRVYRHDQLPRVSTAGMPAGYGGGAGYPGEPPVNEMRAHKFREILSMIEPDSWQQDIGLGRLAMINGHLIVWQTPRVHEQIANLLEELREAGLPDRQGPNEGMMGGMPGEDLLPGAPPPARRRPLPRPAGPSTLENQ